MKYPFLPSCDPLTMFSQSSRKNRKLNLRRKKLFCLCILKISSTFAAAKVLTKKNKYYAANL